MPRIKVVGLVAMVGGSLGFLSLLSLLVTQPTRTGVSASLGATPREIKLTNLTANSATLSWVTDEAVVCAVKILAGDTFADDRGPTTASTLHHVTLKQLRPNQSYRFQLISRGQIFQNQDQAYVLTTAQQSAAPPAAPFYLKGRSSDPSLIYFTFNDSLPLSTLSDDQGAFLLTLSNALKKDRQNYYPAQKGEKGYLLFQTNQNQQTRELVVEEALTLSASDSDSAVSTDGIDNLPPAGVAPEVDKPSFNLISWLLTLLGLRHG